MRGWHRLSLSLSPSLASIPIADSSGRVLDGASKRVGSDTLHRTVTDTIQELSRVNVNEEISDDFSVTGTGKPALHCAC